MPVPLNGPSAPPLTGITVVSVEQAVAAPFATRQLADLGARVIKVERPGTGDFARYYDTTVKGLSSYFVWLNRGKQSLSLDLKSAAGRSVLTRLIDGVDVFVQNLAPGAAARMGLSAEILRGRDERLIVCDVSGYAPGGPFGDRRAYDLLIQCETGLLSVTGTQDAPAKAGISVADIAGGMYAFSSILAALYARERTGAGAALEVSLFEALTEWMAQPMYYAMYTGVPPARTGTSHATIAPYGTFRTGGGGTVQLGVQNDREWHRLCEHVLGRPELADDPRFATNTARIAARAELHREIEAALSAHSPDEVVARLDAAQIANARLNTVGDLLAHPQLAHRWAEMGSPAGPIRTLPSPVSTVSASTGPTSTGSASTGPASTSGATPAFGPIPAVGEHTGAILAELGFTEAEVTALRDAGTV